MDNIFLKKEWQDINKGFIGSDRLAEWIRNYFNKTIVREFVDQENKIAGFSWREKQDG